MVGDLTPLQMVLLVLSSAFLYTWRSSLPLSWTLRIIYTNLRARYLATPSTKTPSKITRSEPHLLLSRLPAPGTDIFSDVFTSSTYVATIDECDFNGHLSNSSYAKRLDFARSEFAGQRFLRGGMDGAWVALGGTSFRYHKEIPINGTYRVRMRIRAWDEKWCYMECNFVSKDRKTRKEVINCTAIAKLCVKAGRKTIPPWLFFALCGYAPSTSTNPKHNWIHAEDLRVQLMAEARRKAASKKRAIKRDSWLHGGGYGKAAGVLTAYVPVVGARGSEVAKDAVGERPEWMEKKWWDVEGWEEQRVEGLKSVGEMGLTHC